MTDGSRMVLLDLNLEVNLLDLSEVNMSSVEGEGYVEGLRKGMRCWESIRLWDNQPSTST